MHLEFKGIESHSYQNIVIFFFFKFPQTIEYVSRSNVKIGKLKPGEVYVYPTKAYTHIYM